MKERLLHTPEGVRDIYNDECAQKKELKRKNPTIPIQMLGYMIENTGSDLKLDEATRIFFEAWMTA